MSEENTAAAPEEAAAPLSEETEAAVETQNKATQEETLDKDAKKAQRKAEKEQRKAEKAALPKMPKFLKFLVVIFALNFILTDISLVLMSRDFVVYNMSFMFDLLNIVLEVVLLWMLWCRLKVARPYVMCYTAFNIIVGWSVHLINGSFNLGGMVEASFFDIILFLYFCTSKKTRAYLTEPFGFEREQALSRDKELKLNRRKWPFYRNLIIYYCVFSLVGHWMELGLCQFIALGLVKGDLDYSNTVLFRDMFYPFPMEGLAVVLIGLLLYPWWRWLLKKFKWPLFAYIISFLSNALLCASIEFVMGLFVNSHLQLWDYSNMPFNFMGQVCLQNTAAFGVVASIIAWMVYPALERLIAKAPKNVMSLIFVITVAAYAIPQCLYLIDPPNEDLAYTMAVDETGVTAAQEEKIDQEYEKVNGEEPTYLGADDTEDESTTTDEATNESTDGSSS